MDETLFYVFGIGLVISAIALSAIGLRFENFPPSRAALVAVVVYFAGMVAATTTFAVLNARDAAHSREAKEATEEAASAQESPGAGGQSSTTTTTSPSTRTSAVKLSAEPDAIAYDTKRLAGHAGTVEIAFTNPSAIAHDVCLSGPGGEQIGCTETVTQGSTSLSENLKPGDYTFFCSVDGHEAAGMKGTLTVK
jgi:plastocyanin